MRVAVRVVVLLVIAAVLTSAATEYDESNINIEHSSTDYQWAELSDSPTPVSGASLFVETHAVAGQVEAESDYRNELEELRTAFDVALIIQGYKHISTEQDATMLEMEMSSALSPVASPSDFFRFTRTHSRLYASEKAAAAAFAAFKMNKKAAAELNAEFGIKSESSVAFAARGPHALLTAAEFKAKILNAKNPRHLSSGKKFKITTAAADALKQTPAKHVSPSTVRKSRAFKPKASAASLQPQQQIGGGHAAGAAGQGAGISGGRGGKSGKTAGQSGRAGGKSGKTGGESGGTGRKSGKTGGKSGKSGGKSGKTGGQGGSSASKSGKTGGGGVVHSSMANGTTTGIALPNQSVTNAGQGQGIIGFTDPAVAERMGITPAKLKAMSFELGRIGGTAYDMYYKMLKQNRMVQRPMQRESQDENNFVRVEPIQINDCGSCWAIAVQQSLQRYWFDAKFKGVLSVQQLLDCARTADSHGCKGGTPMDALEFWASNLAATEEDYPELMADEECKKPPYHNSPVAYPSGGWEMLVPECKDGDKLCHDQIKFELMLLQFTRQAGFQPPIVYVDASMWQNYAGGIFPPSKCSSSMEAGNHVVQIVGSGVDNLGIPYWLIDNFWGNQWGENGRIRLPWGVNACGLFNFAIFSTPPAFAPDPAATGNYTRTAYDPKPVELKPVDTKSGRVIGKTASLIVDGRKAMDAKLKAYTGSN